MSQDGGGSLLLTRSGDACARSLRHSTNLAFQRGLSRRRSSPSSWNSGQPGTSAMVSSLSGSSGESGPHVTLSPLSGDSGITATDELENIAAGAHQKPSGDGGLISPVA